MPRLSRAQEETRRRVANVATMGLAPEPLGARLMAALDRAIPCDGYRLFGVDPRTLLVNRLLAASENDGWARREWLQEVYLAAEPLSYIELPSLMRANLPAVAYHDRQQTCWGYPPQMLDRLSPRDHYHLFHELRSPVGGTLLASFEADGRWVAALQAYRRDADRPFRSGDVAFLRLLAPTIGRAVAASLARERANSEAVAPVTAPAASGIVVLEPSGRVRFSTPAGEAWCDLLNDADREGHGPLPTALWSAVAGLRAGDEPSPASTLVVPSSAGSVRVEASLAGEDGTVAVVLAPERRPEPPEVPADWSLTRQERQVVESLVRGLSNRQIAAALSVSEHTIEWHLGHVYEKLGVRSRSRLVARFFHEVYLSGISESGDAGADWDDKDQDRR